jgi:hypothetical protein
VEEGKKGGQIYCCGISRRLDKFISEMNKMKNNLRIFTTPQLFFQKENNEPFAPATIWGGGDLARHLLSDFFGKYSNLKK